MCDDGPARARLMTPTRDTVLVGFSFCRPRSRPLVRGGRQSLRSATSSSWMRPAPGNLYLRLETFPALLVLVVLVGSHDHPSVTTHQVTSEKEKEMTSVVTRAVPGCVGYVGLCPRPLAIMCPCDQKITCTKLRSCLDS